MVEQSLCKRDPSEGCPSKDKVVGSNPTSGTIIIFSRLYYTPKRCRYFTLAECG